MNKSRALIIFAKAPVPGEVKTRLQTHLSPEECATLHESFVIDTVKIAKNINGADIFLYCCPGIEHPFFQKVSHDFDVRLAVQIGKDLGERMNNAINNGLKAGYEKVVIIGSDSPGLPYEYIEDGFRRLGSSDMVVGLCRDGGYYLIGGRRELPVFNGIPWGSNQVLEMTLKKAGESGITFSVLEEWYDIDTWEDLQMLRR